MWNTTVRHCSCSLLLYVLFYLLLIVLIFNSIKYRSCKLSCAHRVNRKRPQEGADILAASYAYMLCECFSSESLSFIFVCFKLKSSIQRNARCLKHTHTVTERSPTVLDLRNLTEIWKEEQTLFQTQCNQTPLRVWFVFASSFYSSLFTASLLPLCIALLSLLLFVWGAPERDVRCCSSC